MNTLQRYDKLLRKTLRSVGLSDEKYYKTIKAVLLGMGLNIPGLSVFLKKKLVTLRASNAQLRSVLQVMPVCNGTIESFLNPLTSAILADMDSVFEAAVKDYIQNGVDPKKKTVAIYLVGPGYLENLGTIPLRLQKKGYNVVGLCGSTPKQVAKLYREVREKTKIEACFCVGLIDGMPTDTKIIYFVHDIYDSPLTEMEKIHRLLPKCSYIVVPNKPALERYKEKVAEGRDLSFNLNNIPKVCFIPAGYPKLDANLKSFREYHGSAKAIIYATTITKEMEEIVSLPERGPKIIETILTGIPDVVLIFRPHPGTLGSAEVAAIAKKYSKEKRFVFDNNASYYMENYARSALMISDLSGTAFTYSFTTLRPVIFFSHNEIGVQKRFGTYKYFNDRKRIGYIVSNETELLEKVKELLQDNISFSQNIRDHRDSLIYNVGKSEEYFVDNWEYIIEDKKHPDWIYM